MSAETPRWQLVETGKAILIAAAWVIGMYLFGFDLGNCPRCD